MVPKTERGQFRKLTSGDGRKNFDTDVKKEVAKDETEILEEIDDYD